VRRILITGGTGVIGKAVIEKLPKDISVILLTRNFKYFSESKNVKVKLFNFEKSKALPPNLWNATEILHMAGATHEVNPKVYYSINTDFTKYLVELSEKNKIERFTYISTQTASIKGGAYSISKFFAEKIIVNSSLDWTIVRPSEVYGHEIDSMVSKLCKIINKSPIVPIIGNGMYSLNPVHIQDLSNFIVKLVTSNSNLAFKKIYTLCGPSPIPFINFCKSYASYQNKKIFFIKIPVFVCKALVKFINATGIHVILVDQIDRLIINKCHDNSLAFNDYGYRPCTFNFLINTH